MCSTVVFRLPGLLQTFVGYREVCGRAGSLFWFLERADSQSALPAAP